jgi:pterin-4a-carbinolamine dehydratase
MEQTTKTQMATVGEGPVRMNLKPERVQQLLGGLPGWRLREDGSGLESARQFTSPGAAGSFAALACRLATQRRQPVKIDLSGGKVVVKLQGHPARGCAGGLTSKVFTLAGLIGA